MRLLRSLVTLFLSLACALPASAVTIQGFVTDDTGTGVQGVSVKFTGDSTGSQPTLLTDPIGFYSATLSVDTYRVSYIPPSERDLVAIRFIGVVIDDDKSLPGVTLAPGVRVTGLVTDSAGAPLANVDLNFDDVTSNATVFTPNDNTDAAGRYEIVVPPGTYDVEFNPPQFPPLVPHVLEAFVVPGSLELPTVALDVGAVVNGAVVDEFGAAVPDTRLDFYEMATGTKRYTIDDDTNVFGVYRVVVAPDTYEIRFTPPRTTRLLTGERFDVTIAGDTSLSDVVLVEGLELSGRVVDPVGDPVANVDLDVFPVGSSDRLLTPYDDSAADGRYRVVIPPGTYDLHYKPPAGSPYLRRVVAGVVVTADLERPDVVLTDGYLVSGRVVDGSTSPVPGVDLDFIDLGTGELLVTTGDESAADGSFSVSVPPATYEIRFVPPQQSRFVPLVLGELLVDQDRALGELVLEEGWVLTGTAVKRDGAPVGGADIDLLENGQAIHLEYDTTDAAGLFRVVTRAGTYRVRITPPPRSGLFTLTTVEIDVTADLDLGNLELPPRLLVAGSVVDQFAAPVPDVTVTAGGSDPGGSPLMFGGVTDSSGRFVFEVYPAEYRFSYAPASSLYESLDVGPISIADNTTLPVTVLQRKLALSGRAVDQSSAGVAAADVDVLEATSGESLPLQGDLTDADGYFIVGVPEGDWRVRVEPPLGASLFAGTTQPFAINQDTDVGSIVLPRGVNVSGRVVDPQGLPIPGVSVGIVEVVLGSQPKTHVLTDDAGEFSTLLGPGDYRLRYTPPVGSPYFESETDTLTFDTDTVLAPVALDRGWWVAGLVVDGQSQSVAGVDIDLLDLLSGESLPVRDDESDASGAFRLLADAGDYRVRLEPDPVTRFLPLVTEGFSVGPDADLGSLALSLGHLLEGDVFSEGGSPIENVDLNLVDAATQLDVLLVGERTDATGHFLTAVPSGNFVAEYRPPRGSRWLPLRQATPTIATDTLLAPVALGSGWLVSGAVVDPLAVPLADVETVWSRAGSCDPVFTVRDSTGADGRFEVTLAPGTYDVTMLPPPDSTLVPERVLSVAVVDRDVVLATAVLDFVPDPLERCNGIDDDCDGAIDEDFPQLGNSCLQGVGACETVGARVCSADGGGTECNAVPGPPGPESCNGLDNDCDGAVDEVCGLGEAEIEVSRDGVGWTPLFDALHYDVVRGDLIAVRVGGLGASVTTCLANDLTATAVGDGAVPGPGQGFWTLVRGNFAAGPGTYADDSRDRVLNVNPSSCP